VPINSQCCCCASEDVLAESVKDSGTKLLAAGDNFTPCIANTNIKQQIKNKVITVVIISHSVKYIKTLCCILCP